jgi:hypothetical protein
MKTRDEREMELRGLMQTQAGMAVIMELHRQNVAFVGHPASLGRIGLLACQMIPRIIAAEFPTTAPV